MRNLAAPALPSAAPRQLSLPFDFGKASSDQPLRAQHGAHLAGQPAVEAAGRRGKGA